MYNAQADKDLRALRKNNPVMMFLKYNGYYILKFPINPEEIKKNIPSDSQKANVVGIGEISNPNKPKLATIRINSFFWQDRDLNPSSLYIDWLENWQMSGKPAKLIVTSLNYSMYVTCENFWHATRAGEEGDIYFELLLQEYRPHGVKILNAKPIIPSLFDKLRTWNNKFFAPILFNVPRPDRIANKIQISNPYTVQENDTLLSITKKAKGTTSGWKELYDANKSNLADNMAKGDGNLPIGLKLNMPAQWGIQTNEDRLKNVQITNF